MQKSDIIEYFDSRAHVWDAEMIKKDEIIEAILDNAKVSAGMDILDVACGTGVMFPYYLKRDVRTVIGIDIAPNMAKISAEKFADEGRIQVICGDVEEADFEHKFDVIVVYNAFPHFPHPDKLIRSLAALLKDGGRLTVAHGASRETIDSHHKGPASKVSVGLMEAEDLKKIFETCLDVEILISNEYMYQLSGIKK